MIFKWFTLSTKLGLPTLRSNHMPQNQASPKVLPVSLRLPVNSKGRVESWTEGISTTLESGALARVVQVYCVTSFNSKFTEENCSDV